MGIAKILYPEFATQRVSFSSFALFVGTAMSVTAFPVLARILKDRNLLSTNLGATAISCAAVDDVTAWILLALLTAAVHSAAKWVHLGMTVVFLQLFAATMLLIVRPALAFLAGLARTTTAKTELFFGLVLLMLASACATERMGFHPLFGAFMAGLVATQTRRTGCRDSS